MTGESGSDPTILPTTLPPLAWRGRWTFSASCRRRSNIAWRRTKFCGSSAARRSISASVLLTVVTSAADLCRAETAVLCATKTARFASRSATAIRPPMNGLERRQLDPGRPWHAWSGVRHWNDAQCRSRMHGTTRLRREGRRTHREGPVHAWRAAVARRRAHRGHWARSRPRWSPSPTVKSNSYRPSPTRP